MKGSISPRYGGGTVYHYVAAMGYDDTRARGRCGSPTPASGPSGTGAASIRSRRSSRRRATRTPTPHPERPGQHHLHVDDRTRCEVAGQCAVRVLVATATPARRLLPG